MRWQLILFLLIATSIWGSAHLYVVKRLLKPFDLSKRVRMSVWLFVSLLFLAQIGVLFLNRAYGGAVWMLWLQWSAYLYMGFFAILFPIVLFRDLIVFGESSLRFVGGVMKFSRNNRVNRERRTFLLKLSNFGVLGITGFAGGVGVVEARERARVVEVDVPIRSLPDEFNGYRIVQLSDIHVGLTIRRDYVLPIVEAVNELNADMVAITGDLVDGYVPDLLGQVSPIGRIKARDGVFYVTGNHEYYWDAPAWIDAVADLGPTVLVNEHRLIRRGESAIVVAGVTDFSAERILPQHASDPQKALLNAPEGVRILLAHQPRSVYAAARLGYDLQLSGHTHGGQIFPWTLAVRIAHPFANGLSLYNGTQLYVSRGTGYWGPPMRIGAPSEITLLRLVSA